MATPVQQGSTKHPNEPWARLISIQPNLENQTLSKDSYTIGTLPSSDIKVQNTLLKGDLCRISKKNNGCWIENLSTEIFLSNEPLDEGETKELVSGDLIYLLHPSQSNGSEIMGFIVAETSSNGNSVLKRKREPETHKKSNDMSFEKQIKSTGNEDEKWLCEICADYVFQCVTSVPCLHNFCGACLSEWVPKSTECPKCHQEIVEVKKNNDMINKVTKFLKNNPVKQRPNQERSTMGMKNKFRQDRVLLKDVLDTIIDSAKTLPPSVTKAAKKPVTLKVVTAPRMQLASKAGRKSAFWIAGEVIEGSGGDSEEEDDDEEEEEEEEEKVEKEVKIEEEIEEIEKIEKEVKIEEKIEEKIEP